MSKKDFIFFLNITILHDPLNKGKVVNYLNIFGWKYFFQIIDFFIGCMQGIHVKPNWKMI